jgi:hypothetical protein
MRARARSSFLVPRRFRLLREADATHHALDRIVGERQPLVGPPRARTVQPVAEQRAGADEDAGEG